MLGNDVPAAGSRLTPGSAPDSMRRRLMKHVCKLAVVALVAGLAAVPASAAPTKWVRGPVTAISADTITVTVKGAESNVQGREDDSAALPAGRATAQRTRQGPQAR